MKMEGDGPEDQPAEGVDALDDLAAALDPVEDKDDADAHESEDSEESKEEEEVEGEDSDEEDESDEDESDDDADETKRKFTIKHDGKEIPLELTPAEEIAMLQQSYDYSKKTMAVAEERKAVQAEREQAESYRKQVEQANTDALSRLDSLTEYMESQVGKPPEVALISTHGAEHYLALKEQHEARKGQLQQAYQAKQSLLQEQARQRQAWIQEKADSTEKVLKDTLPGWGDNTLNELSEYAGKLGLNPQTADVAMLEPGFWQLLHKAKAYDGVQERKAALKPTEKLAKVIKPKASNTSGKAAERAKRETAFNKNPSVDALAELLR